MYAHLVEQSSPQKMYPFVGMRDATKLQPMLRAKPPRSAARERVKARGTGEEEAGAIIRRRFTSLRALPELLLVARQIVRLR
jgi:hypothetical protein